MGRSETIGSGVKNLYQFTPIYSDGGKPVLFEDDIFKIEIPLNKNAADEQKSETELTERETRIRDLILQNRKISVDTIASDLSVDRRTVLRDVAKMKKKMKLSYDKKTSLWSFD